jgi:hypothetical protein
VGQAFLFDGTANANHVTATSNGLPTGGADRTVEAWVRFDNLALHPYQAVFAYGGSTGGSLFAMSVQNSQLIVDYQFAAVTGPTITQGQVYHVAATYSSGVVTIYVNGANVAQQSVALNTQAGSQLTIGQSPSAVPSWTNSDMAGFVDELTFYNRALTAAEIQSISASGAAGKFGGTCPAGLVTCGGNCIDPRTSSSYCGATSGCGVSGGTAGTACSGGSVCINGACTVSCPASQVACGGLCINPTTDTVHCGATAGCGVSGGSAGATCPNGTTCSGGSCVAKTYSITGSVGGLVGTGLVLQNNGGDSLPISANGVFTFATPLPAGATYNVTVASQPNGRNAVCMVSGGSGTMPTQNITSVTVTCAQYGTTCNTLLGAIPSTPTGTYVIDLDGDGPSTPFQAQCDMTWQGGGWTLIHSTNGLGVSSMTAGLVTLNSGTYMPVATLELLALLSSQVHMRTPSDPTNQSITSIAGSIPIQNLRQGHFLPYGINPNDFATAVGQWSGPFADASHLGYTCTNNSQSYPDLYQACGTDGIHVQGANSRWNWAGGNTGLNQPMDTYVR